MNILLIGTLPAPIGGVTIHIDRFLNIYDKNDIHLAVLDIKKKGIYKKNQKRMRIFDSIIYILNSKIIHIHISNNYIKIFLALIGKVFMKKVIYTHHNSIIKNKRIFTYMYKLCDKIILVNNKEIDTKLIDINKTEIIPAFLPPYKFDKLPKDLENELCKYNDVISTNCFYYNLFKGKHVYGFDLIIKAFYKLSKEQKVQNTILVLVDPSDTTKRFVSDLLNGISFGTNRVLHVTKKIDFTQLVKKSTMTIRATRTDGDSISIRESLYFNIPIITSDVTVRPKGCIIFKNDDSEDLANKIITTLNDKKKTVYKHIDYGQEIINLYKEILKGK